MVNHNNSGSPEYNKQLLKEPKIYNTKPSDLCFRGFECGCFLQSCIFEIRLASDHSLRMTIICGLLSLIIENTHLPLAVSSCWLYHTRTRLI